MPYTEMLYKCSFATENNTIIRVNFIASLEQNEDFFFSERNNRKTYLKERSEVHLQQNYGMTDCSDK